MAKTKDVDMVLVMGLSGAGKSYFINTLTGAQAGSKDEAQVGSRLASCETLLPPTPASKLMRTLRQVLRSVKPLQRLLGTQISS